MDTLFYITVLLWVVLAIVPTVQFFRDRSHSGILLCYLINLFLYHGLNETVYWIGQVNVQERLNSQRGFEFLSFALIGLLLGISASRLLYMQHFRKEADRHVTEPQQVLALIHHNRTFANWCILVGGIIFILVWLGQRLIGFNIAGAIAGCGTTLLIAGLIVRYRSYQEEGRYEIAWLQFLPAVLIPIVSTIAGGFVGYGATALLSIVAFLTMQVKQRWLVIIAPIVFYIGLSFWVSYLPIRQELRESIQYESTITDRYSLIVEQVFFKFIWFDPWDESTVVPMDRFDQNWLLGLSRNRIETSQVSTLGGESYMNILIGPIPRFLWPSKPELTGGSRLATQFTGRFFFGETTVGIGQVMEAYINFGWFGIVVVFTFIGFAIGVCDMVAHWAFRNRRADIFIIAFAFSQPLMSILEFSASIVTSIFASVLVCYLLKQFFYQRSPIIESRYSQRMYRAS